MRYLPLLFVLAQVSRYLDPSPPLFPKDYSECKQLEEAWSERIKHLMKESDAILHEVRLACPGTSGVNQCYANRGCNFWSPSIENTDLGQLIFDCRAQRPIAYRILQARATQQGQRTLCSQRVQKYQDDIRAEKEKEEKERAAVRQRTKVNAPSIDERSTSSNSHSTSRLRSTIEQRAAVNPPSDRRQPARERFTLDEKMAERAHQIQRAREAELRQRTSERQQQLEAARQRGQQTDSLFEKVVDDAKARLISKLTEFNEVTRALVPAVIDAGSTASDNVLLAQFDIAPPTARERVEQAWEKATARIAIPAFADLPFAVVKNAQLATADTIDQLTQTLTDFDGTTVADTDAILGRWQEQVLSPKSYSNLTVDWLTGIGNLQDRAQDYAKTAAARAMGSLLPPPPPASPVRRAYRNWMADSRAIETGGFEPLRVRSGDNVWEFHQRAGANWMEVDAQGIPVLFDRNGKRYGWDASRQITTYHRNDVSRLLLERPDLAPSLDAAHLRWSNIYYGPMGQPETDFKRELTLWFVDSLLERE